MASISCNAMLGVLILFALVCSHSVLAESTFGSSIADLKRAKQRIPRTAWKGDSFAKMGILLTSKLVDGGHRIRPCGEWTADELQQLLRRLFNASDKELIAIYDSAQDNRKQRFKSLASLEAHWAEVDTASDADEQLGEIRRDGLCHEAVMWAVHHISASTLQRFRVEGVSLPSLPVVRHAEPAEDKFSDDERAKAHQTVHREYQRQVSCQQCHTGTIVDPHLQNASLPGPHDFPADKEHRARGRLRRCNFRFEPLCGPCEGLGGRRWGDGVEEFTPMECEALNGPEVHPTTRGCYPSLGIARLTGETRSPLEVFPTGKPGKYPPLNGTVAMGDQGDRMLLRYDFAGLGSEINGQTLEQAKNMETGATIGLG